MFKEMRRKEKQMSDDRIEEILKISEYGVLNVLLDNGFPYGIPVNYVYNDKKLFIHCAKEGAKIDAIKQHDKVSFDIIHTHGLIPKRFTSFYESVVAFGNAKLIQGNDCIAPLKLFIEKYAPEFLESGFNYAEKSFVDTCVIEIEVLHVTGKHSNMVEKSH